MSLCTIRNLSHSYPDKLLYRNASLDLHKGEHMGLVGQNGAGKSTLIHILTGSFIPDEGIVQWQPRLRLGHLDQYAALDDRLSIIAYLHSTFAPLFEQEERMNRFYQQYADTGREAHLHAAASLQEGLEAQDFYTLDTRIAKVVSGLGLVALGTERLLGQLSGGQRAKVILAKLLLEQPDLLLLDEPTNFLDSEHIDWLADYLCSFPQAYIVVSHDTQFLDRISTCICDIEAGDIRKYHGSYRDFLRQKKHLREDHLRRYQAQQREIKRTEEYIRRNIAGVNSRNAKGRRKRLERLERIAAPTFITARPDFKIRQLSLPDQIVLSVEQLQVGYERPLLPQLSFLLRSQQKLVVRGFNGIGKSTLLKTLMGQLPPLGGSFAFTETAIINYGEQDLRWSNPQHTPLQLLAERYPLLSSREARRALSQAGIRSDHVEQEIATLSGGEQSKLKLCLLLLQACHVLILDEPTNHLDAEAKASLQQALREYRGSLILVSHEESFYQGWVDDVIDMERLQREESFTNSTIMLQ